MVPRLTPIRLFLVLCVVAVLMVAGRIVFGPDTSEPSDPSDATGFENAVPEDSSSSPGNFGTGNIDALLLSAHEAPDGLIFVEDLSGPLSAEQWAGEISRAARMRTMGFRIGGQHFFQIPDYIPAEKPQGVGALNAVRFSSRVGLFDRPEDAAKALDYLELRGPSTAEERAVGPLPKDFAEHGFEARSVFDNGFERVRSVSLFWQVKNAVQSLTIIAPLGDAVDRDEAVRLARGLHRRAHTAEASGIFKDPAPPAEPGAAVFRENFAERRIWRLQVPGVDTHGPRVEDYPDDQMQIAIPGVGARFVDTSQLEDQSYSSLRDVTVQVAAKWIEGQPSDSRWGVICRRQSTSDFYALTVGADGLVRIFKSKSGENERERAIIPLMPFSTSATVKDAVRSEHTIQADCVGNDTMRLTLRVNGSLIAEAYDDTPFGAGSVGIYAESGGDEMRVLFDNLLLRPGYGGPAPE